MAQQLGETAQEMMKADAREVERILSERPHGHYWIVIHHKNIKRRMDTGEYVLIRVCKAYDKKPASNLGTIILEVRDGEVINTEVNVHDMPIDEKRLAPHLGLVSSALVKQGRDNLAHAYLYNTI